MVLLTYLKIYADLDADLKIILLDHQNNYVDCLNIFDNAAKCFNILLSFSAISLSVLHNYFDNYFDNKIIFKSVSN